jgi:hypothetical protein
MLDAKKTEALTVVVREFLTDGLDAEEACNTLELVGFKTIIDEIRGNWLHFAHSNKATFQEQDFTDAEFEQVISNVSSEMLSSLNKVAT